jgi:predicted DNA-binding transcriptional regulator YafY
VVAPQVESLALARYARHLSRGETFLLGAAIEEQSDVRIRYTSGEGDRTTRVILPIEIDDGILVAWCYLRDAERNFVLGRIESVEPV